jgi:DnaK suppressor protein
MRSTTNRTMRVRVRQEVGELEVLSGGRLSELVAARVRARLQAERREATGRLDRKLFEARASNDPQVGDEVDQALEAEEIARLLTAARKERALIREIDRAIGKLLSGGYGICEGTGEPIDGRRLEAQPWTRYSLEYLENLERETTEP